MAELHSLGVKLEDVQIREENDNFVLSFKKQVPGVGARVFTFHFVQAHDLANPLTYSPFLKSILEKKFDIYFQNAGIKLPDYYADFIRTIGNGMVNGGFFVTDDYVNVTDEPIHKVDLEAVLTRDFHTKTVKLPDYLYPKFIDPEDGYGVLKSVLQKIGDKAMTGDAAMRGNADNTDRTTLANIPGGIDLNSANLHLVIKRDGNGVPLPFSQQDLAQLSDLQGLDPVILSIKPASQTALFSQLVAQP